MIWDKTKKIIVANFKNNLGRVHGYFDKKDESKFYDGNKEKFMPKLI